MHITAVVPTPNIARRLTASLLAAPFDPPLPPYNDVNSSYGMTVPAGAFVDCVMTPYVGV
jgi:hypothetical protein